MALMLMNINSVTNKATSAMPHMASSGSVHIHMAKDESALWRGPWAGPSPLPVWDWHIALELLHLGVEGRLSQGWGPPG